MSTMNFSLPQTLKTFVNAQVSQRGYGNAVKTKPLIPRELAHRDVEEAVSYYLREGAPSAALGLIDTLERAYAHTGRHLGTGSPRYAHELNLPSLSVWPLNRDPHCIFHIEKTDHMDAWRVLHGQRDLPAWLQADVE